MAQSLTNKRADARRRQNLWGYSLASPWILGFFIFTLFPFLYSIYLSMTSYDVVSAPQWVGLQNYREMFTGDPRYWVSLVNTAYYALFAVPLGIAVALTIAVLLNQGLPGQTVFRTIYYLPSVVSGVALSILWLWLFDPGAGLLNMALGWLGIDGPGWLRDPAWAKPALILMSLWGVGGQMVIFLAGLQGVPREMYQAAEVDGANWWAKLRHITLPMITPTIFFNLVMGVIGAMQVFTQAYVMTEGGPVNSTLFYVLYLYMNAFRFLQMGYASAMAWVLFIIIMALTALQFRLAQRWVYYEAASVVGNAGGQAHRAGKPA